MLEPSVELLMTRAELAGRARGLPTDPETYRLVSEGIGALLEWALPAYDSTCSVLAGTANDAGPDTVPRSNIWQPSVPLNPAERLIARPRAELRGVLGSTLPLLLAVASEGVHLTGQLADRDRLSFLQLCGIELWLWRCSANKQTFEQFLGPALVRHSVARLG